MKIYRAIVRYTEDTCGECESWITKTSRWYSSGERAQKHLKQLKQYVEQLQEEYEEDNITFKCDGPYIEEAEVYDE